MASRIAAFLVWAAVAATAVYWGLKLFSSPTPAPAQAVVARAAIAEGADLSRLLGAEPAPVAAVEEAAPPPDSRFQLIGVVSPRTPRAANEGLAVIAVDGKPARAFRVGNAVDGTTVLQAVQPRGATLGTRGGVALVSLQLAAPPAAATGTLPGAVNGPAVVPAAAPIPAPGPSAGYTPSFTQGPRTAVPMAPPPPPMLTPQGAGGPRRPGAAGQPQPLEAVEELPAEPMSGNTPPMR